MYPSDEWRGSNPTEFLRYTRHRAQKEHLCHDCKGPIYPGNYYFAIAMKFEGEFKAFKSHTVNGDCEFYDEPINTMK